MVTAVTLALGGNGSKIAYFSHSAHTAHGAPSKRQCCTAETDTQHAADTPVAIQPGCMQTPTSAQVISACAHGTVHARRQHRQQHLEQIQ